MKTRAAVLREMGAQRPFKDSQPLKIEEVELDAPGHGEILVRVRAAGRLRASHPPQMASSHATFQSVMRPRRRAPCCPLSRASRRIASAMVVEAFSSSPHNTTRRRMAHILGLWPPRMDMTTQTDNSRAACAA